MSHVIALANHKGGCAKTTSTANLAVTLAARPIGVRVLVIDTDPQGNLSALFGLDDPEADTARLEVLLADPGLELDPGVLPCRAGVDVLACSHALEPVVAARLHDPGLAVALRDLVDRLRASYDYILVDTPPGRQPLSTMALLAADWVIIPARPADLDIHGAVTLADLIEAEISDHHPALRIIGVLLCQVDPRWRLSADAREALAQVGLGKLRREIPFAVRVGQAPRYGLPTAALEPDGRIAAAYRDLASDLHHAITTATTA